MGAAWGFEAFAMIAKEEGERKHDSREGGNHCERIEVGEQSGLLGKEGAEPCLGVLLSCGTEAAVPETGCQVSEPLLQISVRGGELRADDVLVKLFATGNDGGHDGDADASTKIAREIVQG